MSNTAITANRLVDGFVVYLAPDGRWSERLSDAALARSEPELSALQAVAERDARRGRVIAPYVFDVDTGADGPVPRSQRETLRTRGPSVRPDLGYQATRR